MRAVWSALFWMYMAISSTVLCAGAAVIWLLTWPVDPTRRILHRYSSLWAWHYIALWPWWKVTFYDRDKLPSGPAVLIPNHQSFGDILVLYGLFHHFKWVSKDAIFKVPVVGWNMRMNDYVRIKRGSKESARAMMAHCERHLAEGSSVMIFPEGTRSEDGVLKPFKHGAFTLAIAAGVPVVPIAVVGTYEVLPKSGWVLHGRGCDAHVQVLDPIHPDEVDGDLDALMARSREAIEHAQAALRTRRRG